MIYNALRNKQDHTILLFRGNCEMNQLHIQIQLSYGTQQQKQPEYSIIQ